MWRKIIFHQSYSLHEKCFQLPKLSFHKCAAEVGSNPGWKWSKLVRLLYELICSVTIIANYSGRTPDATPSIEITAFWLFFCVFMPKNARNINKSPMLSYCKLHLPKLNQLLRLPWKGSINWNQAAALLH